MARCIQLLIRIPVLPCLLACVSGLGMAVTTATVMALAEGRSEWGDEPMIAESFDATITLFLAGDVMTGRGIDQVLPQSGDPALYESYMKSAQGYVELAELANGPIPKPVSFDYIWGDALEVFDRVQPDARIINLETSVTASDDFWKGKGIHYRMHPDNIPVLEATAIDACSLANNHVLDWGHAGLEETLDTLRKAGIHHAGAGRDVDEATAPAVIELPGKSRVLVFAFGLGSSGIFGSWAATEDGPGVNLLPDLSADTVQQIATQVEATKQAGDVAVASIHWGGNWGYGVPAEQREFAHWLIEHAGIDIVHGHSSHHPKGIEVHEGKLVLYGAGDFINDYEGIGKRGEYRSDLSLMYFATVNASTGRLVQLRMVPMQIVRFRLQHASPDDAQWLRDELDRESRKFGVPVEMTPDGILRLDCCS